jgi:transcriptional regulator with XRE-family HTH domain
MSGSVVVRKSLGRQLKALRLAVNKTPGDVAETGLSSTSRLHRIEKGEVSVRLETVWSLCRLYGADKTMTTKLGEMAKNTNEKGWWEGFSDVMPAWFTTYVELESAASQIHTYDPELVHGLLQTAAYQRAVFETNPNLTPEAAEREMTMRSQRQRAAFQREVPLRMTAILPEGALTRCVGGPIVQAEQLAQLRAMVLQGAVEVRVLLGSAGAHPGMKGAFTVIDFDSELDSPSIVYLETQAGGRYVEDGTVLSDYRQSFDIIAALSIPFEEYQP